MLVITRVGLLTGNYGTLGQKVIHNHSLLVAIFAPVDKATTAMMVMMVIPGRLTRVIALHHVV